MKINEIINEIYSSSNTSLRNYMTKKEFDYYANWFLVCTWAEETGNLSAFSDDGEEIDITDLENADPSMFENLPEHLQDECAEWVYSYLGKHDPAELPTHQHIDANHKMLPRSTWLVHFSDYANSIVHNGFEYGIDEFDKLGLSRWAGDSAKKYGGYNFAFVATSRYADNTASNGKYGSDAVLFQNSGVRGWHYGDEEDQVIFYGKELDPTNFVLLKNIDGDWHVMPKSRKYNRDYGVFHGEFDDCVNWVIKNFAQYRKVLTGK